MKGLTYFCCHCGQELNGDTLEIRVLPDGAFGQLCKGCGKLIQVNF